MYTPRIYQQEDQQEINTFIRQNGFGILISEGAERLVGTHIPLVLSPDGGKLHAHISKANPQWKHLNTEKEVLVIFNGPHTYISSSWYDHENVPTWNYIAVHVYGKLRIIEGDELRDSLKQLTDKYEQYSKNPVTVEGMSPGYFERESKGVVGFEITITKTEAAYKLSQNRDQKNHAAILQELQNRPDADSHQIAEAMKKHPRDQSIKS